MRAPTDGEFNGNRRSRVDVSSLVHALKKGHQLNAPEATPATRSTVVRHFSVVRPATKCRVMDAQEVGGYAEIEPGIVRTGKQI